MLKNLKFAAGLLLLPLAVAASRAAAGSFPGLSAWSEMDRNTAWFVGGFLLWLLLFFAYPRPIRTYVLGHELTHALWGLIMGARVSKLRVSKKGGSVTLDKTNLWITLAPYFFPFYTALALGAYLLAGLAWDMTLYRPFWYGLFGLTWAFHLTFTIIILQIRQPDIHEHGRLFSYVLIYCINLATASVLAALLHGTPLRDLGTSLVAETNLAYAQGSTLLYEAFFACRGFFLK